MALGRDAGHAAPPPSGLAIRTVADDAGRDAYAHVVAEAFAVYGAPRESTRSHFATMESVVGSATQAFLAYRDDRPVAAATLCLSHGVGGIAWVATLPEAGGRGYGAAVTWAVVEEGFRRGARFMSLQASPMGEPMYRRMGFITPTHYALFAPVG
jgi:ribosomal protein S18 acetylase RimI-like enzyme